MTEVPEHLLRRSRERRAALGLLGEGEEGAAAPVGAAGGAPAAAPPARAAAAAEGAELEAGEPGGAVAVLEEEPAPVIAAPAPTRPKVPLYAMVLLVVLPLYAAVYAGAFGNRHAAAAATPETAGATLFAANCAVCHGAQGQGLVGPALANVRHTFPNLADHLKWVHTGSAPFTGKVYGNSGRVATGGMPAFAGSLSDAQIADIVCYERVDFGSGTTAADCPATAG